MAKKIKILYNKYDKSKKKVYSSKRYKDWRKKVFTRDLFTCRYCLKKACYLEAHHIIKKSKSPRLMFVVANGITLCKPCHDKVTGSEQKYADFFRYIIRSKIFSEDKILEATRLIHGTS